MLIAGEVNSTDTVVEIGPGFGVLTFGLAENASRVISFEIERKLKDYWEKNRPENVEIVWGNVLREFEKIKIGKYKVVANLPYQITSNVIRKFLEIDNPPQEMVLMVQKEVGERICANPGEMSLLSVATQYYAKPEIVMQVPRSSFWPAPEVDSAVIKLKIIEQEINKKEIKNFFEVVHVGFAQRRKFLIKNLEPLVGKNRQVLKDIFKKIGLDEKVRAQELSVEQWKFLARELH